MNILLDMNLSPDWVAVIESAGHKVVHWSNIGRFDATDEMIFKWASENDYIIFTHDLDFSTILASSHNVRPSVIQLRTHDTSPFRVGDILLNALRESDIALKQGALVTVDVAKLRIRILPI